MSVVSNLFDVAMVFAVALMVALVSRYNMTEMFSREDFTIVKNPGRQDMEIITKEGEKISRYTPSGDNGEQSGSLGRRVGTAYELENGEIIYVPEYGAFRTGRPGPRFAPVSESCWCRTSDSPHRNREKQIRLNFLTSKL